MVEIVNLRQVRKRKTREVREHAAEENRARFGRSKADVKRETAQRGLDDANFDAHRLDPRQQDEDHDG